ncbi:MAG: hypothetical protein LC802_13420 [Acidobacteria bacterium]|nr:hypothetical protein [Acidobacteriota bacterium]
MRLSLLSLVISLALFAGAGWALRHGAAYIFRDFSSAERISALDTSTIGERWVVIAGGMTSAALAVLIFSAFHYMKSRNGFR